MSEPDQPGGQPPPSQRPAISSEQANELAGKHKFHSGFDLHRRLNRALRERQFTPLDKINRLAAALAGIEPQAKQMADACDAVREVITTLEAASGDGALLAAVDAVANAPHHTLNAVTLGDLATKARAVATAATGSGFAADIAKLREDCAAALRTIRKPRGQPLKDARKLVQRLLPLWEQGTGRDAGYTRDPDSGDYSGPFIAFVEDVSNVAGLGISRRSIGSAIDHTLRNAKA